MTGPSHQLKYMYGPLLDSKEKANMQNYFLYTVNLNHINIQLTQYIYIYFKVCTVFTELCFGLAILENTEMKQTWTI